MSGKKKMEGNPDGSLTSIGNYTFQKTLGEGNFAKVKLAKHKVTGQEVAIKIIDKTSLDEKKLGKLYREVRMMKLLHHPNIVKLYEVIETKYTIFLVMEYISGGELYDYLVVHGRMKEKEARAKFRQIVSAVSYCHKKKVIHRDLKAENLLLDENLNVKIADFGFSNQFDPDGKLDTFCGSPPYAAPELFQGKRYTGPEVDIWSLGVILYVLTTGCLPFDGKNLQEMRECVCRGKYRIPFYLSEPVEKLLRKFLVRDPTKRPGLEILIDDPWMNDGYNTSPVLEEISEQIVIEDPVVFQIMETRFGISADSVKQSLQDNTYDENLAIYFLLFDEKQKHGEAHVKKLGEQMAIKSISSPSSNDHRRNTAAPNVAAIQEESDDPHADLVIAVPASPPPIIARPAKDTIVAAQRRQRRFTVSGQDEVERMAANEAVQNTSGLPVGAVQVLPPVPSIKPQISNQGSMSPQVMPRRMSMAEPRARPMSVAVPDESYMNQKMDQMSVNPDNGAQTKGQEKKSTGLSGFLRLRRASHQAGAKTDESTQPNEEPESSGSSDKPRSLRFTFNSTTTSSKAPEEIVKEVLRCVQSLKWTSRLVNRFLVECTAPGTPKESEEPVEPVKFEIEVCHLPRLKNLHGLKFKRTTGSSSDYKTVCEQFLAHVKL